MNFILFSDLKHFTRKFFVHMILACPLVLRNPNLSGILTLPNAKLCDCDLESLKFPLEMLPEVVERELPRKTHTHTKIALSHSGAK